MEAALNKAVLSEAEKWNVQQQAQSNGIAAALGALAGLVQAAQERKQAASRAMDAKIARMEAGEQPARTPNPAFDPAQWKQQDYAETARWEREQAYQS